MDTSIGVLLLITLMTIVCGDDCSECQPCECQQKPNTFSFCVANCSSRNLDSIPDSLPPILETLDLSHNSLDDQDIQQLQFIEDYLTDLNLSHNNITHISNFTFAKRSALQKLSMDGNSVDHVTRETFGHLRQLRKFIGIQSRKFENNTFENLKGLDYLSIVFEGPKVSEVIFKPLKLKTLHIEFSTATSVPPEIFKFGSDTLLEINMNAPHVEKLHENTFDGLTILKSVVIKSEDMKTLPQYIFHAGQIEKRDMPVNLNSVVIDGVKSVPRNLFDRQQSLKYLSLNNIEDLVLSGTELPVESLDLSGSGVYMTGSGWLQGFRSLRFLNLSRTNISRMHDETLQSLSSLESIDLSFNRLKSIPRGLLAPAVNTLKVLNVSNNDLQNITEWSLSGVKTLETLDLGHNNIQNIDKDAFMFQHMLAEILLNDNDIMHLSSETLANQSRLLSFNVARNQLAYLPPGLFRNTRFLRKLDISGNKIETLPTYLFEGVGRLEFVSLGNNPVNCDCSLMKLNNRSIRLNLIGRCLDPPELKGTLLKNLKLDERCLIETTSFASVMVSTALLSSVFSNIVSSTVLSSEYVPTSTVYEAQMSSEIVPTSTVVVYPSISYDINRNTPEQAQDPDVNASFVGSYGFYVAVASVSALFLGLAVGLFIRRARRKMRSRAYQMGRGHPNVHGEPEVH